MPAETTSVSLDATEAALAAATPGLGEDEHRPACRKSSRSTTIE